MTAAPLDWRLPAVHTRGAIADSTLMGRVELLVRDLDLMRTFYHQAVGLDVIDQQGPVVTLGRGGLVILQLTQTKDLPHAGRYDAGLYHVAIVFENEAALAAAVLRVAQTAPRTFAGAAEHYVSEAFYFTDPEGNGLELYRDLPRELWRYKQSGELDLVGPGIDPNAYLHDHLTEEAVASPSESLAGVGHVHLQIGDTEVARKFYVGVLGFDVTLDWPGLLFVSAGGYHHHIGLNASRTQGAGPRAASLGLGQMNITVPDRNEQLAVIDRLRHASLSWQDDGRAVTVRDPWNTEVRFTTTS